MSPGSPPTSAATSSTAARSPGRNYPLKYSRSKVYDLIRSKRLASFTEGRCRRIPESAVQEYIRTRLEEAS
ncbi:helix-turn-helix domain-containing protein [Streptomyces sp. SCL15-4]|uniref:helix-turn-helix domain-containing protein n=1 Tax=Streptomyces sp. SCL15-4 TaxID=2967221 RepID=UPI0029677694|nr:helix-turn-helix domain-containing protein [Streptomyces sp. SCL15-4]